MAEMDSLEDTRNLIVSNTLGIWYLAPVTLLIEDAIALWKGKLGLYGFAGGRHTWEIAAPLKGIAQHASIWGKNQSACIAPADIARAFDNVTLSTLARAMDKLE
eukprot:3337743-Pyramimonas_sp.AAC.1